MRTAAKDLDAVYKKVRHWDEMDKKGKLKEFVHREIEKQEAKRQAHEIKQDRITMDVDDKTAVDFSKTIQK